MAGHLGPLRACSSRMMIVLGGGGVYAQYTKSIIVVAKMGEQGRDTCGCVIWAGICENEGKGNHGDLTRHNRVFKHDRCYRLCCPICSPNAVAREVRRAVPRLMAAKELYGLDYYPRHIVFSPPQDWAIEELDIGNWGAVWTRLYGLLRKYGEGVRGGMGVLHPFRVSLEGKREYASQGGTEKIWAWIQANKRYDVIFASPHIHAMMYGWLPPADEFFSLTGWRYTVVRVAGKMDQDSFRDRVGYMVSHCGLLMESFEDEYGEQKTRQQNHAIRWFGALSYSKFVYDGEPVKVKSNESCSCCGGGLYRWMWDNMAEKAVHIVRDEDGPIPVTKLEVFYRYRLKKGAGG